ncbi:hemin-degrading factor [Fulvimarina endophytica]|uniref:Hemin-degrading factor n=1 Tax=Fulvimarina endophytica TaxID=2293836 RepID=A0A371X382_9HYPH|nr:ChuX/HutX family heme-like substrate-binding protein [Fulvimarina endophytica]RFC63659.1 hemin-degrading factor [Fulvimarina endophytica]
MSLSAAPDRPAAPMPFYASGKRSRDLAREMGISEAELLSRHQGPEVTRLRAHAGDLVEALPALGEIMALTRNEGAVHEIVGTFAGISIAGPMGLVVAPPLDLRLFLNHWVHLFAVEIPSEDKDPRRSIQVFDKAGDAVIKIHLRPASDVSAFEAIRSRFMERGGPKAPAFEPYRDADAPAGKVDAAGFRRDFAAMRDVHEFFPILRRYGLDRRASLDLMGEDHARRLAPGAATAILTQAASAQLPIMCFVGNRGAIQIFTGRVKTVRAMGPWINVLDPGFDLHLREDLVAEAFAVRKPTKDGPLTSVELFAANRTMIAQFFGERQRDEPERCDWSALIAGLPKT